MIIGRRCTRMYASWMMGEESERITLPIDMKNLIESCQRQHTTTVRHGKPSKRTQRLLRIQAYIVQVSS